MKKTYLRALLNSMPIIALLAVGGWVGYERVSNSVANNPISQPATPIKASEAENRAKSKLEYAYVNVVTGNDSVSKTKLAEEIKAAALLPSKNLATSDKMVVAQGGEKQQAAKIGSAPAKSDGSGAMNYAVKAVATDNGVAIVLDRAQLWKTDWLGTVIYAQPRLAMKDGKITGVSLKNVPETGILGAVGLKSGDTLTSINNLPLNNPLTMASNIAQGLGAPQAKIILQREGVDVVVAISSNDTVTNSFSTEEQNRVKEQFNLFADSAEKLKSKDVSKDAKAETAVQELTKARERLDEIKNNEAADPLVQVIASYGSTIFDEAVNQATDFN